MKADPNLTSLTDEELIELYDATLNRSRAHLGEHFSPNSAVGFYVHNDFKREIDRRVLQHYGRDDDEN